MSDASRQSHWENVYVSKGENEVSWFQESPSPSLALFAAFTIEFSPPKMVRTSFAISSATPALSGVNPSGSRTAWYSPWMSFFGGRGNPSSISTERQTLSTTEHADVTASSGSFSELDRALSRSRLTVSKSMMTTALTSALTTLDDLPGVPSRTCCPTRCSSSPS
jgi:hypothetical protein